MTCEHDRCFRRQSDNEQAAAHREDLEAAADVRWQTGRKL